MLSYLALAVVLLGIGAYYLHYRSLVVRWKMDSSLICPAETDIYPIKYTGYYSNQGINYNLFVRQVGQSGFKLAIHAKREFTTDKTGPEDLEQVLTFEVQDGSVTDSATRYKKNQTSPDLQTESTEWVPILTKQVDWKINALFFPMRKLILRANLPGPVRECIKQAFEIMI